MYLSIDLYSYIIYSIGIILSSIRSIQFTVFSFTINAKIMRRNPKVGLIKSSDIDLQSHYSSHKNTINEKRGLAYHE